MPDLTAMWTFFGGILSSAGLWTFLHRVFDKRSASTRLLMGLARNDIIALGLGYIDRGWITKDEYDDYLHYLYEPYTHFGGNGLAERIVNDVKRLPIVTKTPNTEEIQTLKRGN